MEDLLHFELADGLEVGAAAARFREDVAFLVRQLTDSLGAAGVDAENVNHIVVRGAQCAARCAGRGALSAVRSAICVKKRGRHLP